MESVFQHYDFLRRLAEKRFPDSVMADEAYSYAFDKLAEDDWRRVKAYQGKSSFTRYLGCVWARLLEDFSVKKFGRATPPTWIRNLGGVWEDLFKKLCVRRLPVEQAIDQIIRSGQWGCNYEELEKAAHEILSAVPQSKRSLATTTYMEDLDTHIAIIDDSSIPEDLAIKKETWMAFQVISRVFFKQPDKTMPGDETDTQNLIALVRNIQSRITLTDEEHLMLTAHFIDGRPITAVGKLLGLNENQVHGKFRRLMNKINLALSGVLDSYL